MKESDNNVKLIVLDRLVALKEVPAHEKVLQVNHNIYEPRFEILNNVVCATSKASDQPAHTRSLIRAYASCLNIL